MDDRDLERIEKRMAEIFKQAQDNLTVITAVQDRPGRMLVEHEQWLEENTRAEARHKEWLEEHEVTMRELDRKLVLIADLILKGHNGNGSGQGS